MLAPRLLSATLLAAEPPAAAPHVPLPAVNLGGSNFMDGVAGPGLFARGFVTVGGASSFRDADGRPRAGDHALSTVTAIGHAGFLLPYRLLGAHWGADLLVPVVHVAVRRDGEATAATGLGDVVASPLVIQWPGAPAEGRPAFASRLALSLVLPTGAYDPRAGVNTGGGVLGINPYYAFTIMFGTRLETSWRLHYLWNAPNTRPAAAYGAERVQAGQAFHANAAVSFALTPGARVGAAGYVLAQTTGARIDGLAASPARERVIGLGPGVRLALGGLQLTFTAFWEFAAAGRPEGFRAGINLVKLWPIAPSRRRPARPTRP